MIVRLPGFKNMSDSDISERTFLTLDSQTALYSEHTNLYTSYFNLLPGRLCASPHIVHLMLHSHFEHIRHQIKTTVMLYLRYVRKWPFLKKSRFRLCGQFFGFNIHLLKCSLNVSCRTGSLPAVKHKKGFLWQDHSPTSSVGKRIYYLNPSP